jgi:hypothetical protein
MNLALFLKFNPVMLLCEKGVMAGAMGKMAFGIFFA